MKGLRGVAAYGRRTRQTVDNVARGKSTLQSSTGWGGSSSRAVDGNVSGYYGYNSVTHTNLQSNPWWRVNLQAVYKIDSISIYNRQDSCCSNRLSNFKVDVLFGKSVVWSYTHSGMPGYRTDIDIPGTVNGDSVKISLPGSNKYLSLAEVQVWSSGEYASSAFVFLRRHGALGLGHVGGAFELADGSFMCFSTENGKVEGKGFWKDTKNNKDEVVELFTSKDYTDYKRLEVYNVDPDQALKKLDEVKEMSYNGLWRNCQNDVYDVLHDEGSGYGITANSFQRNNDCYIGWVQAFPAIGPNVWFDDKIAGTDYGKLNNSCTGDSDCKGGMRCRDDKCQTWPRTSGEKCWGWDSDCLGSLGCCDKKCKNKKKKYWWGWMVCP